MTDEMNLPKNPHDRIFRKSLSLIEVARSFFQNHLPPHLLAIINVQTLALCSSNFLNEALKEKESDIIYQAMTNDDIPIYIYLVIEHQSAPMRRMPMRLWQYSLATMNRHADQMPEDDHYPLVLPMVYYHDSDNKAYVQPLSFFDLFRNPRLAREIFNMDMLLFNIGTMSIEQIATHKITGLLEFSNKLSRCKDFGPYAKEFSRIIDLVARTDMSPDTKKQYIDDIVRYMVVTAPITDSSVLEKELEKNTFLVEKKIMPTLADHYAARAREKALQEGLQIGHQEGRQEGRQEGLQEGRQEGLQIGHQEVARSLLNKGNMSLQMIAEVTHLPLEQIEELQRSMTQSP